MCEHVYVIKDCSQFNHYLFFISLTHHNQNRIFFPGRSFLSRSLEMVKNLIGCVALVMSDSEAQRWPLGDEHSSL